MHSMSAGEHVIQGRITTMQDVTIVVVIAIVVLAVVALLALIALVSYADLRKERKQSDTIRQQLQDELSQLKVEHQRQLDMAREDAVDKSRGALKGQAAEIMVSHLPGFIYLPADMHFIGYPIDYIVFKGLTNLRDNGDYDSKLEVILLKIKQGQSHLSPYQQAIKEAIEQKRVSFITNFVDDNATVGTSRSRP